jgi:hypothetical protein
LSAMNAWHRSMVCRMRSFNCLALADNPAAARSTQGAGSILKIAPGEIVLA